MPAKFRANNQTKREPIPEGTYDTLCYGVVELGTHTRTGKFGTKTNQELMIMFEIPELEITYEKDGEQITAPRVINQKFNNVMGEKAKLRQFLEAWRGKKFKDDEAESFDVSKILSHGAQISIEHNGEYANISTISPLHKSVKLGKPHNELINFGIEDMDGPEYAKLYPWIQKIIQESDEWLKVPDQKPAEVTQDVEDEDDIPF